MLNLRQTGKEFLLPHLVPGGVAVDFTMGNGNDTLWLSKRVGESGQVYSFDIQPEAVARTAERMKAEAPFPNYTLICDSHHKAADYVKTPICAGIFNLGFLPGGDKSVTTLRETTLPAVHTALSLLAPKGGLLIAVYPGHEEGKLEGELLQETLSALSQKQFSVSCLRIINAPDCPFLYLIEKNK